MKPASPEDLTATGQAVVAAGGRWQGHIVDQRDIFQLRELGQKVVSSWGGVDILFANAGVQGFAPLATMDDAHWRDHIDVNLTGIANALRVFAPLLIARGGGRISSPRPRRGPRHIHGAAYSASKWGLIGLMKSAALDLGQYGVTVNAVIPGLIDAGAHAARRALCAGDRGLGPAFKTASWRATKRQAKDALTRKSPLRVPWIDPEYVAPVVLFLASPEARAWSAARLTTRRLATAPTMGRQAEPAPCIARCGSGAGSRLRCLLVA